MQYTILGKTGMKVSKIGFGCAPLGNEYGDLDDREGVRAVHAAIDAGVNFFDTSPYYGRTLSESRLGEALKGKRDQVIL
ncbi:MAG: aldo/keto reductase, partial [Anaerolineales bacterium]|nr:aldo/keto reductase [Anaerolineales bacterium]